MNEVTIDILDASHALICGKAYETPDKLSTQFIIAHIAIVGILLTYVFLLLSYIWKMNLFPVKERAPKLALLQAIIFFFLILIPYLTEFALPEWSNDVKSHKDVPTTRKLLKALYFTLRIYAYSVFILRIFVIFSSWKRKHMKIFKKENYIVLFVLLGMLATFLWSFVFAGNYLTSYPCYDWYYHGARMSYEWINPTNMHILEVIFMSACSYIQRNYPSEFNITQEIWMNFALNFVLNWNFEIFVNYSWRKPYASYEHLCFANTFTKNGTGDILRGVFFIGILTYWTRTSSGQFPLPFTWIFRDLRKFIFDPLCTKVFRDYLVRKEPNMIKYLEEIMRIYLKSFTESHNSIKKDQATNQKSVGIETYMMASGTRATSRDQFFMHIEKLQPCFQRFKGTVAYRALYRKVKEFERINERVYQ